MNLIADIGNSFSKVALFDRKTLVRRGEIPALSSGFLKDFIKNVHVEAVGYSNVRDTYISDMELFKPFGEVYPYTADDKLPISIAYNSTDTLGTDRIAAAVYAADCFNQQNTLVIVIGSCITADIITEEAAFQGGTISPGPEMRLKAMHHFTGKLPELKFSDDVPVPGKSTAACMHGGAWHGVLAEIEYYIRHYQQHYSNLNVLLSGGYAPFFEKKINYPIFAQKDIVLKGLNEILNYKLGTIEK